MEREFRHYYPHADLTKFDISDKYGVSFNYKGMGYDVFKDTPSGPQEKYLDLEVEQAMIKALGSRSSSSTRSSSLRAKGEVRSGGGIADSKKIAAEKKAISLIKKAFELTEKTVSHQRTESNFPLEFLQAPVTYYHEDFSKPINRTEFTNLRIYVDASKSFNITLRNIFTNTDIKYYKDAYRWIKGPDLSFWPQMLNFVTWCSTGGCGIAEDMLSLKDNIGGFLRFHVAFTVRRLLFEMSCPLPNDEVFDPRDLKYNKTAAERIQNEFKAASMDFRYTHGSNGGLGDIYATDGKKVHISWGSMKPDPEIEARNNKFPGGSYDFDKPYQTIGFIYNPLSKDAWKYFIPSKGKGLTVPGLARINRSIEAFVYCILGAQVVTRKSIIGSTGFAIETQQEFLNKFIDAIKENSIEKGIARYQLAIDLSRSRLDYTIAPGCWLMPSNMLINTQSVPGYNNKLRTATKTMKFGVNNVNNNRFLGIPSFVESSKKHLGSLKLEDDFKTKFLKDYFGEDKKTKTMLPKTKTMLPKTKTMLPKTKTMLPETTTPNQDDHTFQKIGLSTAAIALGYYIMR